MSRAQMVEDLGSGPGSGTHQLYNLGANHTFSMTLSLLPRLIDPLEIVTVKGVAIYSCTSEL